MLLAAHQPNYLPWLGFFHKIARADVFVVLDDVQFVRGRSYQNRARVIGPNGLFWLTQSVNRKGKSSQLTNEVSFSDEKWSASHVGTIHQTYRQLPHYDELVAVIKPIYESATESLSDTNTRLIKAMCDAMDITTEFVLSSALNIETVSDERLADICAKLGADTYLSGSGASDYQEDTTYSSRGVSLEYSSYKPAPYEQHWSDEFEAGLSIIDSVCNVGFAATREQII